MKNLYIMTVATLLFSSGAAFATEIPGIAVRKVPANVSPLKVDYDNLSDLPIVTEPEGEDEKYSRNSIFFGLDYYGGLYKSADFGCISHVVWGDNGEVYIKNPFSGYDTQTYLVGEMEGIRFRSHSLRKYMRRLIQTGRTTRKAYLQSLTITMPSN